MSLATRATDKKNTPNQTKQDNATASNVYVNKNCFIIFDANLVHAETVYPFELSICYRMHFYFVPEEDTSRKILISLVMSA